jgi:uncharacterized membrane protein
MQKFIILAVVVALVSVLPVHAFNYTGTYSAINVTNVIVPQLYGNSTIDVTYNFSVLNAPATVYVPIPGNAYNIQFYANGVQTPIRETTTGNHTLVAISGINVQQPLTLSFSYKTDIPSSGNIFNYTFNFTVFSFISALNVNTILPQDSFLPSGCNPSCKFYQDRGAITVSWRSFNQSYSPSQDYSFVVPFHVSYSWTSSSASQGLLGVPYYILAIIAAVVIITVLSVLLFHRRPAVRADRPKTAPHKRSSPFLSLLNTDEKKLLSFIRFDKFRTQGEVMKETGFSKSKVSKIVSKLMRYRLIKVMYDGRVNKLKRK